MKRFITIITLGLAVIACAKQEEAPEEVSVPGGQQEQQGPEQPGQQDLITITVGAPKDMETRVGYEADGDKLSVKWERGDKIVIVDNGNERSVFEVTELLEDGKLAEFGGPVPGSGPYTIFYASGGKTTLEEVEDLDYSVQTQSANDATAHLWFAAKMTGVTTYNNIEFSSDWVAANSTGGTYKQSGALRLRIQKPAEISTVKSVTLTAPSALFYKNNGLSEMTQSVTVDFTTAVPADATHVIAYAMLPWSDVTLSSGDYTVSLTSEDYDVAVKTKAIDNTLESTSLNIINLNKSNFVLQPFAGGTGVEGDPWLIGNARQLRNVDTNLDSQIKYFKLIDDINMKEVEWSCINANTPYKPLDFDGNNKKISYLSNSFFYVFCKSSIRNLTLDHCTASDGTQRGIFAQYIQGDGSHIVTNVDVSNSTVSVGNGNMGGLIGRINNPTGKTTTATITDCDVTNTTVTGKSTGTGGLIGSVESVVTVSNCTVKGTKVKGNDNAVAVGGIVGVVTTASSFDGCSFDKDGDTTATITGPTKTGSATDSSTSYGPGNVYVGGIAGEVSGAATFDDCHVKNATVTVTTPASNTTYWKNVGGAFGYIHNVDAKIGHTTGCTVETVSIPSYHYPGGFVSALDGGTIENCEVTGLTISGQNFVGGFVGIVKSGTIKICSVGGNAIQSANSTVGGFAGYVYGDATLESNSTSIQLGDSDHKLATNIGGFAGQVIASANISSCTASGHVYSSGSSVGGFAGNVSAGTFNSCSASGNIAAGGNQIGGFAGQVVGAASFTSCHTAGSVTAAGNNVGGLLGKTTAATISKCSATGNVSGSKYVGGIVGIVSPANDITISISECYYSTGTVSASDTYVGGIVGITYQGGDSGKLDVQNCYVSGNVSSTNQWAGGILGSHYKGLAVLNNCYVTGSVQGTFGLGGIVAYVNATGLEVTRCMPFNSSIHATNTDGNQHYSCGAIIGYAKGKTLICNVSYRPDSLTSNFNDCSGNSANVIEQHAFIATANTIPQRQSLTYGYYHHGRRTGYTLCNLVHSGAIDGDWSSDIWDWSGSRPVLKNNKETL